MISGTSEGWKRFALHFFGFGLPFGLIVWFGGWSGAAVLIAWRSWAEWQDYKNQADTAGKALIDLLAQTSLTVAIAIIKHL